MKDSIFVKRRVIGRVAGLVAISGSWVSPVVRSVVVPVHAAASITATAGSMCGPSDHGLQVSSAGPVLREELGSEPIVVVGDLDPLNAGMTLSADFSVDSPYSLSVASVSTLYPTPLLTSVNVLDEGGAVCDSIPVELIWEVVNLAPTCGDFTVTVNGGIAVIPMNNSYTDPEGLPVTITSITNSQYGSVSPLSMTLPPDSPNFIYTPNNGGPGPTQTLQFMVTDSGGATCTINVTVLTL